MFLWLWNFLRGFVTVEVTGFTLERFLNMAAYRGIYIWEVVRTDAGVRMNVSIRGFKMLKGCARKTKCHMKIARKKGFPFIVYRYRKRKILMGGLLFFILGLYALSSFVWRIDIQGCERLTQEEILSFCEQNGLTIGTFKYSINYKQLQRGLLEYFTDISWADIHTKGTRTSILLAEIIPKQPVIDRATPCHIIASKEGLITGIVTGAGKPLVRQNDVVKQNELLVSGALEYYADDNLSGVAYVHAYAEVWAKRYTAISFEVPFSYTDKVYTGQMKKRYAIQFLFADRKQINLPGSSILFDNYDKITHRNQPGVSGDYPLPFIFIVDEYAEFIPEERTRTLEEAIELADRMLTGRILREFDFQADIIDKQVDFEEAPDRLYVNAVITTNERIDKAVPVTIDTPEAILGNEPENEPENEQ